MSCNILPDWLLFASRHSRHLIKTLRKQSEAAVVFYRNSFKDESKYLITKINVTDAWREVRWCWFLYGHKIVRILDIDVYGVEVISRLDSVIFLRSHSAPNFSMATFHEVNEKDKEREDWILLSRAWPIDQGW